VCDSSLDTTLTLVQHANQNAACHDISVAPPHHRSLRRLFPASCFHHLGSPGRVHANPEIQGCCAVCSRRSEKVISSRRSANYADGFSFCSNENVPHFSKPAFHDSVFSLYEAIRHPITTETYVDAYGVEFNNSENAIWTKSLGSDILIVDMDTRVPNGEGQIFDGAKDAPKMNWEALDAKDTNLVSMATMNHYLYCKMLALSPRMRHAQC